MYAVLKIPMAVYDGTNSAELMQILDTFVLIGEADGVMTLGSAYGGDDRWTIVVGDIACMGFPHRPDGFAATFHVLPEPTP